jgi:hypothetical protein
MLSIAIVLAGIVALIAIAAWVVAAISALQIVLAAPSGRKFAAYWDLGWWHHDALRAAIGPAAEKPLRRYRLAFFVFFACVLGMIAFVFALTSLQ